MAHRCAARGSAVLTTSLLLALTGCGADEAEPEGLDLPSASSASTPEGSGGADPSASGEAADELATSYPAVGLEFTELPQSRGPELEALRTYVAYERGMRKLSRTGEMNPLVADSAGAAMQPTLDHTLDYLRSTGTRYRGTAEIALRVEASGARAAVFDLCIDGSDLELVQGDTVKPINGPPRVPARVVVTRDAGAWQVTQYDTEETSC